MIEICSVHFGPASIASLPIPALSKENEPLTGGVPCSDFDCGLAHASSSQRLQAAALAGELFFCTEVQNELFDDANKCSLGNFLLPLCIIFVLLIVEQTVCSKASKVINDSSVYHLYLSIHSAINKPCVLMYRHELILVVYANSIHMISLKTLFA